MSVEPTASDILRALEEQADVLRALAAGAVRSEELEREYQARRWLLDHGLAHLGLGDPFPFPTLAAWIAECSLRYPTVAERQAVINALLDPVRHVLASPAPDGRPD